MQPERMRTQLVETAGSPLAERQDAPVQHAELPSASVEPAQIPPVEVEAEPRPLPKDSPVGPPVSADTYQPPPQETRVGRGEGKGVDRDRQRPPDRTRPQRPAVLLGPSDVGGETHLAEATQPASAEIEVAWHEMEQAAESAYEELRAVKGLRAEAVSMRNRAQQVLSDAEAIQDEAERVMAQTQESVSRAAAINPSALGSLATTVSNLAEAIRTERHLRHEACQEAEDEADWARQRATEAILAAVSAVRKVTSYVSREFDEARRTAESAEFIRESSQSDLKRAQAILAEAEALMRQEARRLLAHGRPSSGGPSGEGDRQPRGRRPGAQDRSRGKGQAQKSGSDSLSQAEDGGPDSESSDEPLSLQDFHDISTRRPRPRGRDGPGEGASGSLGQPPALRDRPQIPSLANLETALDEFRRSMSNLEGGPSELADAGGQTSTVEVGMPEPAGGEAQAAEEQDQPRVTALDDLVSALDQFQVATEEPQAAASGHVGAAPPERAGGT